MKIQFGISGMLLAVTSVAISLGSVLALRKIRNPDILWMYVIEFQCSAPYWLPIVFLAYVIGRRELKVATVLAFGFLEAVAIAWIYVEVTWFPYLGEIESPPIP